MKLGARRKSGGNTAHFSVQQRSSFLPSLLGILFVVPSSWNAVKKSITATESPICVVRSESMMPSLSVGDVLFLTNWTDDKISSGDVVVFALDRLKPPIVHRVVRVRRNRRSRKTEYLTKGDANRWDDRFLYEVNGLNRGRWLTRDLIVGKVQFTLPWIGNFIQK